MAVDGKLCGKSLVVEIAGELDLNNADEFRTALDSLIDSHQDVKQVVSAWIRLHS